MYVDIALLICPKSEHGGENALADVVYHVIAVDSTGGFQLFQIVLENSIGKLRRAVADR